MSRICYQKYVTLMLYLCHALQKISLFSARKSVKMISMFYAMYKYKLVIITDETIWSIEEVLQLHVRSASH